MKKVSVKIYSIKKATGEDHTKIVTKFAIALDRKFKSKGKFFYGTDQKLSKFFKSKGIREYFPDTVKSVNRVLKELKSKCRLSDDETLDKFWVYNPLDFEKYLSNYFKK